MACAKYSPAECPALFEIFVILYSTYFDLLEYPEKFVIVIAIKTISK